MNQLNSIPELQNQDTHLQQLAAQRELYSEAKATLAWQMILTIIVGIIFALSLILLREKGVEQQVAKVAEGVSKFLHKSWGTQEFISVVENLFAFLCLLITIFDVLKLEPQQKKFAQQAAKIQEVFDCEVLSLPWQESKTDMRPMWEDISDKAEKHRRTDAQFSKLVDWYSPSVGHVPLGVARHLCQRANIRWDKKLRGRYIKYLSFLLTFIFVLLTSFGMFRDMTLSRFIFSALIPMMPSFIWGTREYKKQRDTISTLERLEVEICRLWDLAIRRQLDDEQFAQTSRAMQNEIFDHRRSAPFIFEWIYNMLRKKDDERMNKATEDLVKEYLESEKKK